MAAGPLELIVLGFPGSKFSGAILPALIDLIEREIVRVVDLVIVQKNSDGLPEITEIENTDDPAFAGLVDIIGSPNGLIGEEDIVQLAEDLEPGDTAAMMLFEHTWANTFVDAVRKADGELLLQLRIPQEVVEIVETAMEKADSK